MCSAGRMPLASVPIHCALSVLCGSQPCVQAPGRRGGARPQDTQEHGDLCAPQASGRGSLGALLATGDLGGGHPLVLCALPCPGAGQQAAASTFTEACLWQWCWAGGRRIGAGGCGEQASRCPLQGRCFTCPHGSPDRTQGWKGV